MSFTPRIESTYMPGEMAWRCTYPCPACGTAAVGYDSRENGVFIGVCPRNHTTVCDTRRM
jgi:hypothetical protein